MHTFFFCQWVARRVDLLSANIISKTTKFLCVRARANEMKLNWKDFCFAELCDLIDIGLYFTMVAFIIIGI